MTPEPNIMESETSQEAQIQAVNSPKNETVQEKEPVIKELTKFPEKPAKKKRFKRIREKVSQARKGKEEPIPGYDVIDEKGDKIGFNLIIGEGTEVVKPNVWVSGKVMEKDSVTGQEFECEDVKVALKSGNASIIEVLTSPDGTFKIPLILRKGIKVNIIFSKKGYDEEVYPEIVMLRPGIFKKLNPVVMKRQKNEEKKGGTNSVVDAWISGTVIEDDEIQIKPIVGAQVTAILTNGSPVASIRTREKGAFVIPIMTDLGKEYKLIVQNEGFEDYPIDNISIEKGEKKDIGTIKLRRQGFVSGLLIDTEIKGVVKREWARTDRYFPLRDVKVVLVVDGKAKDIVDTDENGEYKFTYPINQPTECVLRFTRDKYVPVDKQIHLKYEKENPIVDIVMQIEEPLLNQPEAYATAPVTLTGIVKTKDYRHLKDYEVSIETEDGDVINIEEGEPGFRDMSQEHINLETRSSKSIIFDKTTFTIKARIPKRDKYFVIIKKEGYNEIRKEMFLNPGEHISQEFKLIPEMGKIYPASIHGFVAEKHGFNEYPIPGANIHVSFRNGNPVSDEDFTTDTDGSYRIPLNIAKDSEEYIVTFSRQGYNPRQFNITVQKNEQKLHSAILERTPGVEGIVTSSKTGKPLHMVDIYIQHPLGHLIQFRDEKGWEIQPRTDQNGRYMVELKPGNYNLIAWKEGYKRSQPIQVEIKDKRVFQDIVLDEGSDYIPPKVPKNVEVGNTEKYRQYCLRGETALYIETFEKEGFLSKKIVPVSGARVFVNSIKVGVTKNGQFSLLLPQEKGQSRAIVEVKRPEYEDVSFEIERMPNRTMEAKVEMKKGESSYVYSQEELKHKGLKEQISEIKENMKVLSENIKEKTRLDLKYINFSRDKRTEYWQEGAENWKKVINLNLWLTQLINYNNLLIERYQELAKIEPQQHDQEIQRTSQMKIILRTKYFELNPLLVSFVKEVRTHQKETRWYGKGTQQKDEVAVRLRKMLQDINGFRVDLIKILEV